MPDLIDKFKRITIYGGSGSGKTTLTNRLGKVLGVKTIHMDDIFWGPNWEEPTRESFEKAVRKELFDEEWVSDGNYSRIRKYVLEKATFAVILKIPLYIVIWRLIARSISRNTRFKLQKVTPLPKRIEESGVGEKPLLAIIELSYYTIKTRRKKLPGIIKEVEENLGENYLILHHQSEIDELVNKIALATKEMK